MFRDFVYVVKRKVGLIGDWRNGWFMMASFGMHGADSWRHTPRAITYL